MAEQPIDETRKLILAARKDLRENPAKRGAFALHEAAHVHYARRAGAIGEKYYGPVEYPGKAGVFGWAAVQVVWPPEGARISLLEIARWLCAGSVVKRSLAPNYWESDEDVSDYEVFVEQYASKAGLPEEEIKAYWQKAKQDVERDLRNPAFRHELGPVPMKWNAKSRGNRTPPRNPRPIFLNTPLEGHGPAGWTVRSGGAEVDLLFYHSSARFSKQVSQGITASSSKRVSRSRTVLLVSLVRAWSRHIRISGCAGCVFLGCVGLSPHTT